jgi:uncharacterized surface anchored protein
MYPFHALAADRFDRSTETSLTVMDQYDGTPIAGVEFRLYQVADITEDLEFAETAEFQNTGVSVTKNDSSWADQATTLEAYVVERIAKGDPITPAASGVTDSAGKLSFSGLQPGLYLLVSDQKTQANAIYKTSAVLLTLPYQETDGSWNTDPTVYAKNGIRELRDALVDISAVKVWKDSGHTEQRPQSVTVTLYQDDAPMETVTLSESNSWRYTWKDLDALSDYHLVEQNVPAGYSVTTVQNDTTFVVTNTYTETPSPSPSPSTTPIPSATPTPSTTPIPSATPTPTTTPVPSGTPTPTTTPVTSGTPTPTTTPTPSVGPSPSTMPTPSASVSPSVSPSPEIVAVTSPSPSKTPTGSTAPSTSPTTTTSKLPQTGQLWWPVTILALLGLALLMLGWGIHRRGDDNES